MSLNTNAQKMFGVGFSDEAPRTITHLSVKQTHTTVPVCVSQIEFNLPVNETGLQCGLLLCAFRLTNFNTEHPSSSDALTYIH